MPRTSGAKNKPKSDDELIKILKERGYDIVQGANAVKEAIAEAAETPKKETKMAEKSGEKFEIKPPEIETEKEKAPAPDLNSTVFRCGNPACNKILSKPESVCPYCGVKLEWQ